MSAGPTALPYPDEQLVRYLLGELGEEERERIQAAYFEDPALFERLLGVEDDLLDAYARGQLRDDERRRIEERFRGTDAQRARLGFARALARKVAASSEAGVAVEPTRPDTAPVRSRYGPTLRVALAASLVLAALAGAWWWAGRSGTPPQARDATPLPASPGGGPALAPAFASIVLRPGLVRGADPAPAVVALPPGAPLRVRLEVEPEWSAATYRTYRATVQTAEGVAVFRSAPMPAPGVAAVDLEVPAGRLAAGDHVVLLEGERAAGEPAQTLRGYAFRVR